MPCVQSILIRLTAVGRPHTRFHRPGTNVWRSVKIHFHTKSMEATPGGVEASIYMFPVQEKQYMKADGKLFDVGPKAGIKIG